MMKKILLHIIVLNVVITTVSAQELDTLNKGVSGLNIFYDLLPDLNTVTIDTRGLAFKITDSLQKGFLGLGASYAYTTLNNDDDLWMPESMGYENFHQINVNLSYAYPISNKWSVALEFSPLLASTFEESLHSNAVVLGGAFGLKRHLGSVEKPSYIALGLARGTLLGSPSWYPTLSYFNTVNDRLRYSIGFPESMVYYRLNRQHSFDFTIAPQSLYVAHGLSNYDDNMVAVADDAYLEFTALQIELGYDFKFDDVWSAHFNVGYASSTEMEINTDNTTAYDFEPDDGFVIGFGIRFNINNK
jgi:long-subunit fatty acid transport protein